MEINDQNTFSEPSNVNKNVVQMNLEEAQKTVRAKGSWFFWIAVLSLVNSFLAAKGSYFIAGLAISQIIDGVVVAATGNVNYVISLLAPALFALFGYFAYKLNRWAFIVGSVIYLFDAVIYLYFQSWLAAGFHVFVLYKLFQGYKEITAYEVESVKLS